jgi:Domain of unknown function (DUF222)
MGEQVYDYGVFEELGTAIDELDIPTYSTALAAVVGLRDRLDAHISDAVATHDQAGLWELDGASSMTAWLADRAAMPRPRAAAMVSRARKLAHLPVTAAAWRNGTLSSGQVEAIAAHLDPDTVGLFADHETELVPTLVGLSVRDVAAAMAPGANAPPATATPNPNRSRPSTCHRRWPAGGGSTVISVPRPGSCWPPPYA